MKENSKDQQWRQWLKSDECLRIMNECACRIHRLICSGRLTDPEHMRQSREEDSLREIEARLWIFLFELNDSPQKKHWLEQIRQQNFSTLKTNIVNKYRQAALDKLRKKNGSAWHACYRRARNVFGKHADVRLLAEKQGSFYSPMSEPENMPKLSRLNPEFWKEVPPPPVHMEDIRKTETISRSGLDFWHGLAFLLRDKHHLALRIFIDFLAHHFPQECADREQISAESPAFSKTEENKNESLKDTFRAEQTSAEHEQTRARLRELARDLAQQLEDKEKIILDCMYGRQMTKSKTAEELGYSHAAGLAYPLAKLLEKVRRFCSLWPGLDGESHDQEMAAEFLDIVIEFCKSRTLDRN